MTTWGPATAPAVIQVEPYTAPCPACGHPISWRSVMRTVQIDTGGVNGRRPLPAEITEAQPGDCVHCDTADVRDQLNDSLNRETA